MDVVGDGGSGAVGDGDSGAVGDGNVVGSDDGRIGGGERATMRRERARRRVTHKHARVNTYYIMIGTVLPVWHKSDLCLNAMLIYRCKRDNEIELNHKIKNGPIGFCTALLDSISYRS